MSRRILSEIFMDKSVLYFNEDFPPNVRVIGFFCPYIRLWSGRVWGRSWRLKTGTGFLFFRPKLFHYLCWEGEVGRGGRWGKSSRDGDVFWARGDVTKGGGREMKRKKGANTPFRVRKKGEGGRRRRTCTRADKRHPYWNSPKHERILWLYS